MGEFGTDSFLARPRRKMFHVDFVGRGMVMDICFGNVLFSPFSMCATSLNFHFLCLWIGVSGQDAYSGTGWLPGLNGMLGNKPWASSFGELASFHLERCLGAYPVDFAAAWTPLDYWDADDTALGGS